MIFTEALRLYCKKYKISVRQLAKEAGLVHGTAAAFLRGDTKLEEDNFAKLLAWAMRHTPSESIPSLRDGVTERQHDSGEQGDISTRQ